MLTRNSSANASSSRKKLIFIERSRCVSLVRGWKLFKEITTCFLIARPIDRATINWIIECGDILTARNLEEEHSSGDVKAVRLSAIMKELGMDKKQVEPLHGNSITSTCGKIVTSLFPVHLRTSQAYSSLSSETCKAIRGNSSYYPLHQCLLPLRLCPFRPSNKCESNHRWSVECRNGQRVRRAKKQGFEAVGQWRERWKYGLDVRCIYRINESTV